MQIENFTDRFVVLKLVQFARRYPYSQDETSIDEGGEYISSFLRSSLLDFAKEIRREVEKLWIENPSEMGRGQNHAVAEILALLLEETNNT